MTTGTNLTHILTNYLLADNSIPCGDTTCHPAWTCQRIDVPCTRSPCEPTSYFCMAPHTSELYPKIQQTCFMKRTPSVPPPTCGDQYCSTSETCNTVKVSCSRPPCPPDRKVCVLLPGATCEFNQNTPLWINDDEKRYGSMMKSFFHQIHLLHPFLIRVVPMEWFVQRERRVKWPWLDALVFPVLFPCTLVQEMHLQLVW